MDIVWLKDLVLIIFCILGIGMMVALSIMAFIAYRRVNSILDSARGVAKEVSATTYFISDNIVRPLIQVASFISGVRRAAKAFSGRKDRGNE